MPEGIVLHVGIHKTGTTSFQHFLRDHNDGLLAAAGVRHPEGFLIPTLHTELALLTVRPERTWPARIRFPDTQRAGWQAAAEAHVRRQVTSSAEPVLVYSHEDLSYLRSDDELDRLKELMAGRSVRVVVVLRDRADFLRSYGEQLIATGFELSDELTSFAYVGADSWLVDYDGLLDGYRRCFGADHVTVVDYDETLRRDGSVIPAVAELLGIARSALPSLDLYSLNQEGGHIRLSDEQLAAVRRRVVQQAL